MTQDSQSHMNWRGVLDAAAALAMLLASAGILWAIFRSPPRATATETKAKAVALPAEPISLEQSATKGSPTAPVVVIEFSDFECPFCTDFATKTLPELLRTYVAEGKVLFAFQHLPLEAIHPMAVKAAEAAECAGAQGKFWEMHDLLFQLPKRTLSVPAIRTAASSLALDSRFEGCLAGETTKDVRADLQTARELQISGTPTFLFGRLQQDRRVKVMHRVSGALPFSVMSQVIEGLLPR